MSIALAGSIGLQIYWIGWSIRLNEEQFDKSIFTALNRVSDKLEFHENAAVLEALNRAKVLAEQNRNIRQAAAYLENGYALRRVTRKDSAKLPDPTEPNRTSGEGDFEQNVTAWEYMKVSQLVDSKPLAERVQLDILSQSLREELANQGLSVEYRYGVFSKERNSFVIADDHFVVTDNSTQFAQGGESNLYTTKYKVALFRQDIESPGLLSVFFPARTSLVLGSVWKTLLMSVFFTATILFCFWYTIQVIFRQKQLSEMKNDFINNMTHEFKTPIATISLAADSIGSPMILDKPDKIKRFVDIIRQENRRMNAQVERVLQLAMVDKKDFELKVADLNLHEIIGQAVENFSLQVEKRSGTLTTDLQASLPVVEGDATHIASVIHNLLDNANKYSPDKPEITIATRNTSAGVEVTISDKGIGIGKEARKFIFDKFYRVHTGDLHDVKGFGLGLSYVKAIMVAHRGMVDVRSELGKGSSFTLTFPARGAVAVGL